MKPTWSVRITLVTGEEVTEEVAAFDDKQAFLAVVKELPAGSRILTASTDPA